MSYILSKSQFKPKVLEYLRLVEQEKKPLIITHDGQPTVKVEPYVGESKQLLQQLKNSVLSFEEPTKPVGLKDWEVFK